MIFTAGYILLVSSFAVYLLQHGFFLRGKGSITVFDPSHSTTVTPTLRVFVNFPNKMENKSPCFGPETMIINDTSKQTISGKLKLKERELEQIVDYLSKSKSDSSTHETVLHVPDWANKLFEDANKTIASTNDKVDRSPYFLTAVVRLRLYEEDKARLTIAELKQWIHYQFWAGVEHIYICNHFLKESERIEPHLRRYIDIGAVTVYPWSSISAVPGSASYSQDNTKNQDGCYNFVLKHHSNESVWQYNMDMDEYPFVPSDQCEGFFKRYLFNLDQTQRKMQVTQIKIRNFLMKGVGDRSRDMSIDRINRIDRKESNPLVKPCYKPQYTVRIGTHGVTCSGQTLMPNANEIAMIHYWGSRDQNWGPDTEKTLRETLEFNVVRETIAVNVRHSLLSFADFQGFNSTSGP